MDDQSLKRALQSLGPGAVSELRQLLFQDQNRRDEVSEKLLRTGHSYLADLLDLLSLNSSERKRLIRLLSEVEAQGGG